MAGLLKRLGDEFRIDRSDIGFDFMDRKEKASFLESKRTLFFHEMCATLTLAYRKRYAKLRRVYPRLEDVVIADYDTRIGEFKRYEEAHRDLSRLQKAAGFADRALMRTDHVWFLFPLRGSFCKVYVADFVARDTPFLLRCAKLCAACWLYYNRLYYGSGEDPKKLRNIPDAELVKNSYLALIGLGMGAWLGSNLETVSIREKEGLKKAFADMRELDGGLAQIKKEVGFLDCRPGRREVCGLLFGHVAHVNSYLIRMLGARKAAAGEDAEIRSERGDADTAGKKGLALGEHRRLLRRMEAPLEKIAKNLSKPRFKVREDVRDFPEIKGLSGLSQEVLRISKGREYRLCELKNVCSAFHKAVHVELGYVGKGMRAEKGLP